ncbi:unnamed protein product [Mytilus edulis]|uniref:DZIP3-like HEPN domain-containing protein n=1 Tax=Mytilus edulis TaxID=6550 RepID=A0A8S3SHF7_MYTED|nr:unnamed protein product [Mytilus edulis]
MYISVVFEAEINVIEKYSKTLANSNSNEFKAFANRVQPILKGLYDSVTGEQDVEIVKCRQGPSDTVHVLFHLISHGNNDEDGLRKITERKIQSGSLSLSYGITDDGFTKQNVVLKQTNVSIFEVTLKLAEKYSDSKELANPKSEAFKSLKEKVQPEILSLYDSVCGSQEIDILKYKSSGAAHSIIFNLTSRGCSDESILKEPIETQIQTGLLGSSLKVSTSGLTLQKLTERVFYQVTLNVKRQFTDELKRKHSTEFNAFSKFVQSVLSTHYEKVPGNQEVNVVKCQQGPSGTVSTDVIIEIISHGCTDEVMVLQPIQDIIAFGKLDLTLKTSPTDFTFKTVRGSKPVSSECFDLSLLITLLRRDSNVKPPKNGFDVLPSKDDISDGAQIATIKHYRNELAHARDAKMDENKFDSLWIDLKNAVRILGKDDKFMKAVDDASTMKLDSSTEKALIRMVQHDKQLLQLEKDVTELYQIIEKLTKQTEDQSTSTQEEVSKIKDKIGKKEEQILQIKTDMQTLHTELHRIEKKFDEKFRVQDERNVQQDEMNRKMESGIQENRRDIQRLDPRNKRKRNLIDQTESRIRKFMEDTKETFVETETQKKVLKILERDNCLVMISKGGRGKTALGLQIASIFKDKEFTPMYIVNNEIETMRDIIDFESKNFIIVDDLFGQTNSHINDHTLEVFYSSVKRANCQSKVILNIRESPGCNKSILESHPILKESQVINLDDNTYDLSQSEKKEILLKHMKKFNLSFCHCNIFDLVCKESIYTDTDNQSLVNTREKLVTTMKNLCAEGYDEIQKKYHYSTLVYAALKGNIDLNYLNECLLLKILSYYEQKDEKIRKTLISKAVQDLSLNGKYLVKDREGETYRFQHATILEAVLISYGKACPEDLLVACSASFFQEYIRPESYRKFKKPKHVYLFVSDDVLSNNLLSLLVKKHEFKSVGMLKLSLQQRDNDKSYLDDSYLQVSYETDLEEDQRYIEYDEYGAYHGWDPYQIDCNLNPMYHKIIGQYLFDMGVGNELDSFVQLFLLKLSRDFLESEKIDPDLMKFFFDGFTCRGTQEQAVSKYLDFFTKYLCKYGSFAVIQAFCKPLGRIADTDNRIMVPVDDTVLAKKYIEIFFNSYADENRYEYDDPRVEYLENTRTGNLLLILCCLNQPCRENNLETVGDFLHMNFKRDLEFVNFILDKLIGKSKCNYIDAFEMKPLLDGLTDYGKNLEIISTNYDFCDECLFKYGSIPVVLSLCRPLSYKGSDQDIVRVDNQLLANKLVENLKFTPEDWDLRIFDDIKPIQDESYWYRPCRSNTKYIFFKDKAFYDKTYFSDLASYIYNYGVLENDEEFIQTVLTAIHSFENIEEENCYSISEKKYGPRDPLKLCKGRLENLTDCFSTLEIREMKRKFPSLLDSLLILYDSDDLLSDSDENSDTSNTDHEDDDINEPETGLDVDGHDAYNYEEIGINEADYNEDAEGGEDDGIHE